MNITALFLLSVLTMEAAGAGQRMQDVPLGAPCNEIVGMETHQGFLGSTDQGTQRSLRYRGTLGGRKATIIDLCDDGRLTEQTIIVAHGNRDQAYRFADEQKKELAGRLGEPIHDGLELGIWKRFYYGFMGADLDYLTRVVVWGKAKEDVMLLIRETDAGRWEVSVSRGSSKTEFVLNL